MPCKTIRLFLIAVFATFSSVVCMAQDDCEQTIAEANAEFQAGHFYNIPSILDKCLKEFTTEQSLRANLLLTQTYLLLDDPIGAKNSYLEVLKANPEFVADVNIHPADVVYLSKSFTATPIFAWFGKIGTNVTPVRQIHEVNAYGEQNAHEKYSLKVGYQVMGGGDFYLSKNFAFRGELGYSFQSYRLTSNGFFEKDNKTFTENMGWLSLPVSFMYTEDLGKYRPYGYVGYGLSFLVRDKAQIEAVRVSNNEDGAKEDKQSPDIDFIQKRNRFNTSIVFGGGVKAKFGLQFLFVDLRYSVGLKNIVKTNNLYGDNEADPTSGSFLNSSAPVTLYGHVDDLFRLDNLSISVGFIQPLYQPRQLKRVRLKSVKK